jgi:hypothetical protein
MISYRLYTSRGPTQPKIVHYDFIQVLNLSSPYQPGSAAWRECAQEVVTAPALHAVVHPPMVHLRSSCGEVYTSSTGRAWPTHQARSWGWERSREAGR